ncbi:DUF5789 family protein [Halegenticoccus soli]|uniref:DUF5789 family protein n=1 Tax=Halegenticoccus soli TaxID=1985678 RepID=UPI000C6EBC8F|nr:hypothetical protein [Halegenticoccus soli]
MSETVKLSRVETLFGRIEYPATRDDAAAAFGDVTVLLADGQENLGELIADVPTDTFDGPDELSAELNNALPIEAVGEPMQSDGDA